MGIGREVMVMVMVMRGMTRNDKKMMLLLPLDILTKPIAAKLLTDADRSPQAQAWYKLTF